MVSKCANPACSAAFRFLHQGKIFSLVAPPSKPSGSSWQNNAPRVERYWLCDECAQHMTLVWDGGRVALRVLPRLGPQRPAGAPGLQAA